MKLSMQQIREFARCPLKYKLTYIDKRHEKLDRDEELHQTIKAIATWFFDRTRTGTMPGKRQLRQKWGKLWHKDKTAYDIIFDTSYKYERRRNIKGVKILDRFYDLFSENPGVVIANDFDFDVPIGDGHILTGSFDLIREVKQKKEKIIQLINWRTDAYVPYQELRDRDLHLTAQDYAFRKMFDSVPDQLVYYAFSNNTIRKTSPMQQRDFNRLKSSINNIASIIDQELYFPRQDEQHNICRYCDYTSVCWNWK